MNKVEVTLSEETLDALAALLGGGTKATATKKKPAPVEEEDDEEEEEAPVKKTTGKKKPAPAEEEDEEEDLTEDDEEDEGYTKARVVEKCQEVISAGKAAKLKVVLAKFGAAKVVNLKEKDYDKFMAEVKKIK